MTLWMSKSVHWIQRYSDIYFYVSWFVQSQLIVPHDWIGLEKLPPNDSLSVQICPLDQKIQWYLFLSQLICTVIADLTSWLDWPQKTTPKWPFECPNPSTGSKDTVFSWSVGAVVSLPLYYPCAQFWSERLYCVSYEELNKNQRKYKWKRHFFGNFSKII